MIPEPLAVKVVVPPILAVFAAETLFTVILPEVVTLKAPEVIRPSSASDNPSPELSVPKKTALEVVIVNAFEPAAIVPDNVKSPTFKVRFPAMFKVLFAPTVKSPVVVILSPTVTAPVALVKLNVVKAFVVPTAPKVIVPVPEVRVKARAVPSLLIEELKLIAAFVVVIVDPAVKVTAPV